MERMSIYKTGEIHQRLEVSAIPLISATIERLGIRPILSKYISEHANEKISTVDSLILLLVNIVLGRQPLYELEQWFEKFDANCFGQHKSEKKLLNDDRFGRALDKLYAVDRASLMTEIVLNMIKVVGLDLSRLHNDSTTVKAYGKIPGKTKTDFQLKKGHSKEHRPDLKQLLFCLSISADGAVPIHYKSYSGNRTDDTTHIETWNTLRKIAGCVDFLYVADCKVCTDKQLASIVGNGGRVVTIIPDTWKETKEFKNELCSGKKKQKKVIWRRKHVNHLNKWDSFSLFSGEYMAKSKYKIHWIYSTQKKKRDRLAREKLLISTENELSEIMSKMNTRNLKSREQIEAAVNELLQKKAVVQFYHIQITEVREESKIQIGKGRPGEDTKYKTIVSYAYSLSWVRNKTALALERKTDGVFPLLSTDPSLSGKKTLTAYKYQPKIEKRFTQFRSVHLAGPLLFKKIERVESVMFLYFLGLMIQAVIEREVRQKMKKRKIKNLAIYPEYRLTATPTTARILENFEGVSIYKIRQGKHTVKTFRDNLSSVQKKILSLLNMKEVDYWKNCALS